MGQLWASQGSLIARPLLQSEWFRRTPLLSRALAAQPPWPSPVFCATPCVGTGVTQRGPQSKVAPHVVLHFCNPLQLVTGQERGMPLFLPSYSRAAYVRGDVFLAYFYSYFIAIRSIRYVFYSYIVLYAYNIHIKYVSYIYTY